MIEKPVIGVVCNVTVWVNDAETGKLIRKVETHNVLTDEGLEWWRYNCFNDITGGSDQGGIDSIDLGDGSTDPDRADTDLDNLIINSTAVELSVAGPRAYVNYYLPPLSNYNGSYLREIGLRTSTTSGGSQPSDQLLNRAVLPLSLLKALTNTMRILVRFYVPDLNYPGHHTVITFQGRQWLMQRLMVPTVVQHITEAIITGTPAVPFKISSDINFPATLEQQKITIASIVQSGPGASITDTFASGEANLATNLSQIGLIADLVGSELDTVIHEDAVIFLHRGFSFPKVSGDTVEFRFEFRLVDAIIHNLAIEEEPAPVTASVAAGIPLVLTRLKTMDGVYGLWPFADAVGKTVPYEIVNEWTDGLYQGATLSGLGDAPPWDPSMLSSLHDNVSAGDAVDLGVSFDAATDLEGPLSMTILAKVSGPLVWSDGLFHRFLDWRSATNQNDNRINVAISSTNDLLVVDYEVGGVVTTNTYDPGIGFLDWFTIGFLIGATEIDLYVNGILRNSQTFGGTWTGSSGLSNNYRHVWNAGSVGSVGWEGSGSILIVSNEVWKPSDFLEAHNLMMGT